MLWSLRVTWLPLVLVPVQILPLTATVLNAMTAARTRAAAATVSRKRSQTENSAQIAHAKKRKRSDLDQTLSDSEVKPSSPEVASHKKKQNSIKSDAGEYSGPYPQHNRPTPQECQASLGCVHKLRELVALTGSSGSPQARQLRVGGQRWVGSFAWRSQACCSWGGEI